MSLLISQLLDILASVNAPRKAHVHLLSHRRRLLPHDITRLGYLMKRLSFIGPDHTPTEEIRKCVKVRKSEKNGNYLIMK